jgi:lysophospholipid acyltransferase
LEFFGYAFFFAGVMVGPAFEFSDYRKWTRKEVRHYILQPRVLNVANAGLNDYIDFVRMNKAPYDKIPSAGMPAAKTLFLGLICMAIFFKFGSVWNLAFLATNDILEYPLLFR